MQEGRKSVCGSIAERLQRDIELGIIDDGERLPSCRELAIKLGVNPNTVQKAFTILEQQGFIEVIPQKGAYARKSPLSRTDINVKEQAEKQITALKNSGLTLEQLKAIAGKVYGEDDND